MKTPFNFCCSLVLVCKDIIPKYGRTKRIRYKLLQKSKTTENDPEKVIFNFSKYVRSDIEKKLPVKGLNFCLPPKQLKYADYLVHFELFYRDTRNLEILPNEGLDFVKTKTKETALSSFRQYNKSPQQNFTKEKLVALTNLSKNKDIVIQKFDKGNFAVIVDKVTYIKKVENLLSDQRKFEKVTLKNDAFLNFVVNQGKRTDIIFKFIKPVEIGKLLCMEISGYINNKKMPVPHFGQFYQLYRFLNITLLSF